MASTRKTGKAEDLNKWLIPRSSDDTLNSIMIIWNNQVDFLQMLFLYLREEYNQSRHVKSKSSRKVKTIEIETQYLNLDRFYSDTPKDSNLKTSSSEICRSTSTCC